MSRVTCVVRPMSAGDITVFVAAFGAGDANKRPALFHRYLDERDAGGLVALTALLDGAVAGYVTLLWTSRYPPFARHGIPEIVDLNVVPDRRRHGVGDALVAACEDAARAAGRTTIGLGVGLYADYGSAQRCTSAAATCRTAPGCCTSGAPWRPARCSGSTTTRCSR